MGAPGGVHPDRDSGSSQSSSVNQSAGTDDDDIANNTSCQRCWGHRDDGAKGMAPGKSAGLAPAPSPTWMPPTGEPAKTSSLSRARLSSGAARFCSFLRRPAAWKLPTAPERTEAAGAFQHVSAAAYTERSVRADAGSRLHREAHVTLFAQAIGRAHV